MSELDPATRAAVEALVDARVAERVSGLESQVEALTKQVAALQERMPRDRVSMLVFSGEMDNLLAAFIVASGAAAMGLEVTMYFTFWGLNALRQGKSYADKSFAEKLVAAMMPSSPASLASSRLHMLGLGPVFFRKIMADNHVESLPDLIAVAQDLDVEMVACEMSMGVMGVRREELIDGIEYGGVATYIDAAADAKITLFI